MPLLCLLLSFGIGWGAQQKEEEVLKDRASTYWEAHVKKDWATVFTYLPAADNKGMTQEKYVSLRKEHQSLDFLSYELGGVEILDDIGWVEIRYKSAPAGLAGYPPTQVNMWQLWRRADQGWFPLPPSEYSNWPNTPPHLRQREEEDQLRRKVDSYWNAREAEDWQAVYWLLDPGFRAKIPLKEFLDKKAMFSYVSHRIHWVEAVAGKGKAKVSYMRRLNDPNLSKIDPVEETIVMSWDSVDGTWYCRIQKEIQE
jgi:hypothetical protein